MTHMVRHPELKLLTSILAPHAALRIVSAPGGWRTLSAAELHGMDLSARERASVLALQELTRRGYPEVREGEFVNAASVAQVYGVRLADLEYEVVLGLALDGGIHLLQEIELARGGLDGAALLPPDVFRPLIRAGASACLLLPNHPSGDPTPSAEDVEMTRAVAAVGDVVGIPLLDHVVIGARGGGWTSLFELGVVDPNKEESREQTVADQTV